MPNGKEPVLQFIKISSLDHTFEAQIISSILTERGIPFEVRSFHDTAYDGLYQMQKGWGEISAPATYREEILEIIHQVRTERPDIQNL